MDVSEFKAWFDGFTEAMTKPPSVKQWERIKQRVKQVDGTPTTERHFYDRYWCPSYAPYWSYVTCSYPGTLTVSTTGQQFSNTANVAFTALGKAEAQSVAA